MPIILLVCPSEDPLDKDFIKISTYIMESADLSSDLDSSVDKRMSKIIFKMKKYYIICVWNRKSIDFNIPETAAKNTLVYGTFNKEELDTIIANGPVGLEQCKDNGDRILSILHQL